MEGIIKHMKEFVKSEYVKLILSKEECKEIIKYYEEKGKSENEEGKNNTQR